MKSAADNCFLELTFSRLAEESARFNSFLETVNHSSLLIFKPQSPTVRNIALRECIVNKKRLEQRQQNAFRKDFRFPQAARYKYSSPCFDAI